MPAGSHITQTGVFMTKLDSQPVRHPLRLRRGDDLFIGILAADFFGAIAASLVFLSMVWWVLEQGSSDLVFGLMMLSIVVPMNIGVILSGPGVARIGARKLLLISKLCALGGASLCLLFIATDVLTLPLLAVLAIVTYGSLGPSVTADLSRAPAIARLAGRRLIDFNAADGLVMLAGSVLGFWLAGRLNDQGMVTIALGIAVIGVALSTYCTWLSFPRDRKQKAFDGSAGAHLADLVRKVLVRILASPALRNMTICGALLLAVSDVYEEIFVPLSLRAQGAESSMLSYALIASLLASAVVSVLAPALHERISSRRVFAVSALAGVLVLGLHLTDGGFWVMIAVIVITSLGAGVTMTIGFTHLQESMPQSLQAQAIGIWQSFVMTVGSLALLAGGLLGTGVLWLLVVLAAISALASLSIRRS